MTTHDTPPKPASKGSRQAALRTECISKTLCQIESVAVNHFILGESACTDLPFSPSEVLTDFTTAAKASYADMLNLTLYRNPAVEQYFYS